jgi:uncharacterized protein YgbK (DUF1537 family)
VTELAFAAIADDFTGAVDLAGMLVRGGLRTVLAAGVAGLETIRRTEAHVNVEAVVIALKTRSIEARLAVEASVRAAEALKRLGARQLYFKYCSTFDSTPQGNIGPVAEALRALLGVSVVPFVPSFPENGRRVYRGHLFVGDALLSESGMERHPLNPMRDSNLVRVLASQSQAAVALVSRDSVQRGPEAVKEALAGCEGHQPLVIVDAIDDADLGVLAAALHETPFVTGGSALAFHLARHLVASHKVDCARPLADIKTILPRPGRCAILAGSCSSRTREQIAHFFPRHPTLALPVLELSREPQRTVDRALQWFETQSTCEPVLIHSSDVVDALNESEGLAVGRQIEGAFASIAQGLIARGVTRLIVAGGETSGAVVTMLNIPALSIGPEVSPGVSWTQVLGGGSNDGICLALKSGNFGAPDLFTAAFERLDRLERAA